MRIGDKVGIVCCSNGQKKEYKADIDKLDFTLKNMGLIPVYSPHIYEEKGVFSGSAKQRGEALMSFYKAEDIGAIYDISGGDIANEVLPYLDYGVIANSNKHFWGYSDLTTIINAIYTMTENESVLYMVKNLVYQYGEQQRDFIDTELENGNALNTFSYSFYQGDKMEGVMVGGNIRCLLKLAGTRYFPDMSHKILLLEALGGEIPQLVTYLNQLKQLGTFNKVNGILLGTFTTLQNTLTSDEVVAIVQEYVGENIPIAKTEYIGHGADSKAAVIGRHYNL